MPEVGAVPDTAAEPPVAVGFPAVGPEVPTVGPEVVGVGVSVLDALVLGIVADPEAATGAALVVVDEPVLLTAVGASSCRQYASTSDLTFMWLIAVVLS